MTTCLIYSTMRTMFQVVNQMSEKIAYISRVYDLVINTIEFEIKITMSQCKNIFNHKTKHAHSSKRKKCRFIANFLFKKNIIIS